MNLFNQSLQQKDKIMIFYMDNYKNVTQRIVRMISLEEDSIVVFCYYRKQVRTFKLNNILSAGPIAKKVGA